MRKKFIIVAWIALVLLIMFSINVFGLALDVYCSGSIERSDDINPLMRNKVGTSNVYVSKSYICEGDTIARSHEHGAWGFCNALVPAGADWCHVYSINYDENQEDCHKYGDAPEIDRLVVFDPSNVPNGCCGDDQPKDGGSDPADNPDDSRIFCNGGLKYNIIGGGCPVGRLSKYDSTTGGGSQTHLRAWGGNLNYLKSKPAGSTLGCCGDDYGDDGVILTGDDGMQYVCDNEGSQGYEWRPADHVRVGGVYEISTVLESFDAELLNPKSFPSVDSVPGAKDVYDVLGTDNLKWIACDTDGSLGKNYHEGDVFKFVAEPCDEGTSIRCRKVRDSDFACYDREKEEIAECHAVAPKNKDFTASSAKDELNVLDESTGFTLGKAIPNPFSDSLSELNKVGLDCDYDFCSYLYSDLALKLKPGKTPAISDWTSYDALHFNIFFEKAETAKNAYIYIKGGSTLTDRPLSLFFTGSRPIKGGIWYHVIIPKPYLPSGTITAFRLRAEEDVGRINFNNMYLSSTSGALFCGRQDDFNAGKWTMDFDNDDASGGIGCNSQQDLMYWTGSQCCGDDYSEANMEIGPDDVKTEFYTDSKGNCFNSRMYPLIGSVERIEVKHATLNQTSFRVLSDVANKSLVACNPTAGYEWLKDLVTTDTLGKSTGETLLDLAAPCDARGPEGEGSYYCGEDGWSDDTYEVDDPDNEAGVVYPYQRTHQAYDASEATYGCCREDDCWTGTTCIDSQEDDQPQPGIPDGWPVGVPPVPPKPGSTVTGSRCVGGDWVESNLKWDWLDSEYGFCGKQTSCLLDPNSVIGETEGQTMSACKADGWYSRTTHIPEVIKTNNFRGNSIQGLYCQDGTWTSRTNKIAQKMLTTFADAYTLTCGPYHDVLVNEGEHEKAYVEGFLGGITPRFTNRIDNRVFNNLCVLQHDDTILVGSSFNALGNNIDIPEPNQIPLHTALKEAFNVDVDISECSGSTDEFDYKYCGEGFYWNDYIESFLYTPSSEDILKTSFLDSLYDLIIEPVKAFFAIKREGFYELPPTPLNRSTNFEDVYVAKFGSKLITSIKEAKASESGQIHSFFTVQFTGFEEDICKSVDIYDQHREDHAKDTLLCDSSGDKTTVFAVSETSSLIPLPHPEFFRKITRELRPE